MEGVPGVQLFTAHPKLANLQKRIQKMCEWKKGSFYGELFSISGTGTGTS
jgi:hypothetical protein